MTNVIYFLQAACVSDTVSLFESDSISITKE